MAQSLPPTAAEFKGQKRVARLFNVRAVAVPPGLFHPRQPVLIDVFQVDHFLKTRFTVRASPAAQAAAAVRRLGDRKSADEIVYHHHPNAQLARNPAATLEVVG